MSEYRSELLAVNERITALEAELARLGPKVDDRPRSSARRTIIVTLLTLIACGLLFLYVIAGISQLYLARPAVDMPSPPVPADPPRLRTGLMWLESTAQVGSQGQRFLDVDGDGKPELIGLSWDRAVPDLDKGLHVVALDARTLRAKWTSDAYAGTSDATSSRSSTSW